MSFKKKKNWKNNKRHGYGITYYTSGAKYEGIF